jgi:uncharacterized protein (DUF885 family)
MTRLLLAAVAGLALAASSASLAQAPQATNDETARLNTWFEARFEEQLAFSPIQQTFLGRKSDQIDEMTFAAQDKQLAWQRASVAEMRKSFDYARLSPEGQTSYDTWIYQWEQAEAAVPFRTNAYIFDQMSAVHAFFPQLLIAFHAVDTPADMDGYIKRISESARALRQLARSAGRPRQHGDRHRAPSRRDQVRRLAGGSRSRRRRRRRRVDRRRDAGRSGGRRRKSHGAVPAGTCEE